MKKATVSVCEWKSHPRYRWVAKYSQGGKRITRYFTTKKAAKGFADEKKIELLNDGRKHGEWSDDERRAVIEAREIGAEMESEGVSGFSLREAVMHYAAHLRLLKRSATVERALDELIDVRRGEGKSGWHVRDLEYKARKFANDFKGRLVASVTSGDVAQWLLGMKCQPQTRLNYKRLLHNLFAFALSRGYTATNPVAGALSIKVPPKDEIGILSVPEARALLASCSSEILPAVAIGMFTGLRREEIARLDWQHVNFETGLIDLKAGNAKKSQRRLVPISANLRAWLLPHRALAGRVRPSEAIYRTRLQKATETAGIALWPHNALRHSFASYHLAMHEDAGKTAHVLGHMDSATLYKHYRELVRPEEAMKFWDIKPDEGIAKNVLRMDVAA